jgi:hypothetical protein
MKQLLTKLLLILPLFALCGCDERALDFAKKTKDILDQRSAQLAGKIAAEKKAYNKSAAQASENHRILIALSLQNDRNERSSTLAADYDEGRKPISLWRKDLAEYATIDYETNRELLTAEMDAQSQYLQSYEDLKIEQDKVEALSKLLAALAKKPSLKSDISDLASFAQDTKEEFDKQVCKQLQSQMKDSTVDQKAASGAYCSKNCNDILKQNETCPAQ